MMRQRGKKCAWRACLAAMLLAAGTIPAGGGPAGWKLAFADDFERDVIGDDWKSIEGTWTIQDGWLRSAGTAEILISWRFEGPQRLEYDARSAAVSAAGDHDIRDLSAALAANEAGYREGYFFGFASDNNTGSKILARCTEIARYPVTAQPFTTHRVACEWDGSKLTHSIDGRVVGVVSPEEVLVGPTHRMVSLCTWGIGRFDNVGVYTRTGEAVAPVRRRVSIAVPRDPAMAPNGSFERSAPGARPTVPANWLLARRPYDHTVELLSDPDLAHRGRCFLRLTNTGEHPLRVRTIPDWDHFSMQPGAPYRIRVWARLAGETPATLIIEPGGERFDLTNEWKEHVVRYTHPQDAKRPALMSFAIDGGPADVDDASIVPDGGPAPMTPELAADWRGLTVIASDASWRDVPGEPAWRERIPVILREVMDKPASNYAVSLPVQELFRSPRYDFVRPEKIMVVDPSRDGRATPWTFVSADTHPRLSAEDRFVFLADCPPRAETTYHIYLKNRDVQPDPYFPTDAILETVNVPTDYPYRIDVDVADSQLRPEASRTAAHGAPVERDAMWWETNAQRVYEDDPPRYDRDHARIAAAANEWEAFQAVVTTVHGMAGVMLAATDLLCATGGKVAASNISIEYIEQSIVNGGLRTGRTPDPLVPWDPEDIEPGGQRVAWVTVKVPKGTSEGVYAGAIVATTVTGKAIRLPVELEVFGFSLPDSLSFTPVLGCDHSDYLYWTNDIRRDLAHLLGRRHITPFYYNQPYGPYDTPWNWDEEAETMSMDFTPMDKALGEFEAEGLDIKYLFLGSTYRVQLNTGYIFYRTPAGGYEYGRHGTERGRKMLRAWLTLLADHLREKGWADRAIVYTNDESWRKKTIHGESTDTLISDYSRLIHQIAPEFGTFCADYAKGGWPAPMEHTDHFSGLMSEANRKRFVSQGGTWWGPYNRYIHMRSPLAVPRLLALDCWLHGWSHYFHWAIGESKAVPNGQFAEGFDFLVYPWLPRRGPWQPGRSTVCSSIRVEALRESTEDFEYLKMLSEQANRLPADTPGGRKRRDLLERARSLIKKSSLCDDIRYGGSHSTFVVDGDELQNLRREIGRALQAGT